MKKYNISVYNVKEYLEERYDLKNIREYKNGIAIIQGKEDVLVFNHEGCGFTTSTVMNNVTFDTIKETVTMEGEFKKYNFSQGNSIEIPIAEIIEKCEKEVIPLDQFVDKNYNKRLKENHDEIVGLLKEML